MAKRFYTYKEAMLKVHDAGIKTGKEYDALQKTDPRLPSTPRKSYKEYDNTEFFSKETFYTYQEAMSKVRDAGIKTKADYREWQKSDPRLPSTPNRHYFEYDAVEFFGKKTFYSYDEAISIVQNSGVNGISEYRELRKSHPRLPSNPQIIYPEYDNIKFFAKVGFYTYQEAIRKVHDAGIKSSREYQNWQKSDPRLPATPSKYYDEYDTLEFFGNEAHYTYQEAILKVRGAGVKTTVEYAEWQKKDPRLPSTPQQFYEQYDHSEFFGKESFFTYEETKSQVHNAGIKTYAEYEQWQKMDSRLPSNPRRFYEEFKSEDFFVKETFYTYQEALREVRNAGITTVAQYDQW